MRIMVTDRSRLECYEHCPRHRYLAYEWQGRGLTRTGLSLDLEVGTATHAIIADVLTSIKAHTFTEDALTETILKHLRQFDQKLRARGLSLELESGYELTDDGTISTQAGTLDFTIALYSAWIQQSIRAWTAIRLPQYVQNYEIMMCEEEVELLLADGRMVFMTRPDAVLKRYSDGHLFVLDLKTVGEPKKQWLEQWPLDQISLSQVLPIEARFGQRVSGVLIEGLVKGGKRLQYPSDSGNWWINSPLVWMWKKEGAPPFPAEYAARYEWRDEEGRSRRLGRGWMKQPAWEDEMGLDGWLSWLHQNDPQVLREQFVDLPPILRDDAAVEKWRATVEYRERIIDAHVDLAQVHYYNMDELFPMHTSHGNCLPFGHRCEMYNICHGTAGVDPLGSGYQLRDANHPREAEYRHWHLGQITGSEPEVAAGEAEGSVGHDPTSSAPQTIPFSNEDLPK